jgi:hypothetical protein
MGILENGRVQDESRALVLFLALTPDLRPGLFYAALTGLGLRGSSTVFVVGQNQQQGQRQRAGAPALQLAASPLMCFHRFCFLDVQLTLAIVPKWAYWKWWERET